MCFGHDASIQTSTTSTKLIDCRPLMRWTLTPTELPQPCWTQQSRRSMKGDCLWSLQPTCPFFVATTQRRATLNTVATRFTGPTATNKVSESCSLVYKHTQPVTSAISYRFSAYLSTSTSASLCASTHPPSMYVSRCFASKCRDQRV